MVRPDGEIISGFELSFVLVCFRNIGPSLIPQDELHSFLPSDKIVSVILRPCRSRIACSWEYLCINQVLVGVSCNGLCPKDGIILPPFSRSTKYSPAE